MDGHSLPAVDPAADRAVALMRDIDAHRSDEPQIAEPSERLIARVMDVVAWLVLTFLWSAVAVVVDRVFWPDNFVANSAGGPLERIEPVVSWGTSLGLVASIVLLEAVPTARTGRSFSKRRVSLLVVGPSGEAAEWWRATLRHVVWFVPAVVGLALWSWSAGSGSPLAWLGLAMQFGALAMPASMFFSTDHRGLHDRIAGTRVLSDR